MSKKIFKSVDSYTLTPFKAYKEWALTNSTITQYSSSVMEAIFASASLLEPYAALGDATPSISKVGLFNSIYHLYYARTDKPFDSFGNRMSPGDRSLAGRAVVVSIGKNYIGEEIKPESISITDNSTGSVSIVDDIEGNLYDTDVTNIVSSDNEVGYWSFDDSYRIASSSNSIAQYFTTRNYVRSFPHMELGNAQFKPGVYNNGVTFNGNTSSFGVVQNYNEINFRSTQNFAVSFWANIPPSQSVVQSDETSILEKWNEVGGYPFAIRTYNAGAGHGQIYGATSDGNSVTSIQTTGSWNDGTYHHIVYQKNEAITELFIDGVSAGVGSVDNFGQTHNNSGLGVGGRLNSMNSNESIQPFSGSIDEIRIYSSSLTDSEVSALYSRPSNTAKVGNVFYGHGMLVFTNLSGSYTNLLLDSFNLSYKSTVTIREHETIMTAESDEFNMTFNPTTYDGYAPVQYWQSYVTSSEWSPYITTIGLYNNTHELVAVAKFAKPIKKFWDIPLTFVVRFDG